VNILKLPTLILTTLIALGSANAVQAKTFDFADQTPAETTLAQGFFRNILNHKVRHHRRHHNSRRQVHHNNRHHQDNHRQVHNGDRRHHQPYRSHQRRQHPHHQNHDQHQGARRVNYYR